MPRPDFVRGRSGAGGPDAAGKTHKKDKGREFICTYCPKKFALTGDHTRHEKLHRAGKLDSKGRRTAGRHRLASRRRWAAEV